MMAESTGEQPGSQHPCASTGGTGGSANRTPGHRRANQYQRQIAKVRRAIDAGELVRPSVATVRVVAGCGRERAQAIIAELVESGDLQRTESGRARLAA